MTGSHWFSADVDTKGAHGVKTQRDRADVSGAGRALLVGACALGAVVLLGVALGPLWWWIAPRPEVTALGEGNVFPGTSQDVFAMEGHYVLITAVAGVVTGYSCYMVQFFLAERRMQDLRLPVLLASFLGAAVAALLVWRIGVALDAPAREAVLTAAPGEAVTAALRLQATAFVVVWPFVHVLQYGLLDGISLLRSDQPGVPGPDPAPEVPGSDAPGSGASAVDGQAVAPPTTDTRANSAFPERKRAEGSKDPRS